MKKMISVVILGLFLTGCCCHHHHTKNGGHCHHSHHHHDVTGKIHHEHGCK